MPIFIEIEALKKFGTKLAVSGDKGRIVFLVIFFWLVRTVTNKPCRRSNALIQNKASNSEKVVACFVTFADDKTQQKYD